MVLKGFAKSAKFRRQGGEQEIDDSPQPEQNSSSLMSRGLKEGLWKGPKQTRQAGEEHEEELALCEQKLAAPMQHMGHNIRSIPDRLREQLRQLREQAEPFIESRLARHQGMAQKIDVLLRGGKPRPFALVGASGTGKSFRALLFAENHHIPYLIDDGILIEGGRIVAGRSAKNEQIYLRAIKTALFDDPDHLSEVRQAIKEYKVQRVLLVGTSVKMIRMIGQRLGLPKIAESDITYIEDISSPDEIEQARKSRSVGHHIIPVPAVEVSREYGSLIRDGFQVFLSDLRMGMKHYLKQKMARHPGLFGRKGRGEKVFEKTVVKPQFMRKALENSVAGSGRIQMTESALRQMLLHCIDEYSQDAKVLRIRLRSNRNSYKVKVLITLPLHYLKNGPPQDQRVAAKGPKQAGNAALNSYLYRMQNYVVNSLHRYAGVTVEELNIEVVEFV